MNLSKFIQLLNFFGVVRLQKSVSGRSELIGPGGAKVRVGSRIKKNGWCTWRPSGSSAPFSAVDRTLSMNVEAPQEFFGARLAFFNYSTASEITLTAGVTSVPTIDSNGYDFVYRPVTFDSGATFKSIPAATMINGQVVPTVVYSDPIWIKSVPRTDFPARGGVLCVRAYAGAVRGVEAFTVSLSDASYTESGIRIAAGAATTAGDKTTSGSTISVAMTGEKYIPACEIQFLTGGSATPIRIFGDSLSAYPDLGWRLHKAIKAATSLPVTVSVWAVSGQKREVTSAVMRAAYSAGDRCGIAVLWNYSVNGTGNESVQGAKLLADIEYLSQIGLYPIVLTMHGRTSGADAPAQSSVVTAFGSQYTVVDVASLLESPDGKIIPAYTSDGTHLTTVGYDVIAPEITRALLDLIDG